MVAFAFQVTGAVVPRRLFVPIHVVIALLPAGLWLGFAYLPERAALEPRRNLDTTFALSALVASGLVLPLLNGVFQTDRWLPLADTTTRIIGYTVTFGVLQELCKYLIVRLLAWELNLRVRVDAVAYSFAAGVGFATTLALDEALRAASMPSAAAFAVFDRLVLAIAPGFLLSYGIAEARFGKPTAFLQVIMFALAALSVGAVETLRTSLVNAGLSLTTSAPTPLFGFVINLVLLFGVSAAAALLVTNAERRAAEQMARE